jgi:hypothetical protein
MLDTQESLRQSLRNFCINGVKVQEKEITDHENGDFKPKLEDLSALEFICQGPGGTINRAVHKGTQKKLIVKAMRLNRRLESRIERYGETAHILE